MLVAVRGFADRVAHALTRPFTLRPGPGHQVGFAFGELLVFLTPMASGDLPFFEEAVVATTEDGVGVLREIEFEHAGHAA